MRHFASGVEPEARKSVELRQDSARNYPERRDLSGLPARRVDFKRILKAKVNSSKSSLAVNAGTALTFQALLCMKNFKMSQIVIFFASEASKKS